MSESNGATDYASPAEWPTASQVKKLLGCSDHYLKNARNRGDLHAKQVDGIWHYDPESIDDLRSRQFAESTEAELHGPDGIRASGALLKQAHSHLEKLLPLTFQFFQALQDQTLQHNRDLQTRCRELEAAHEESVRTRERLLSEEHDRRLASEAEAARNDRRSRMLKLFEERAPGVLDGLMQSWGMRKEPKIGHALELLQSLQPAQLEVLLESDFVDEKQKALIRSLLGLEQPAEPEKEAASGSV